MTFSETVQFFVMTSTILSKLSIPISSRNRSHFGKCFNMLIRSQDGIIPELGARPSNAFVSRVCAHFSNSVASSRRFPPQKIRAFLLSRYGPSQGCRGMG